MMTNPAAAMRMLITYSICIPVAIIVGWILTNPLDYGSLGFILMVLALIISPVFIKWHYPIMVFGLAFPVYLFFLIGRPPCWQVVVLLSLGIAVVERMMNSDRQFLRVPSMTWPLLFTLAVMGFTMALTGGTGLHTLGGEVGGGKKYVSAIIGVLTYFALTSRRIPREHWKFYIGLYFLSALPQFISDFPRLPQPLTFINYLFPPAAESSGEGFGGGIARYGSVAASAIALFFFLLARHGLRGIFTFKRPYRAPLLFLLLGLSLLGGYRGLIITNFMILFMLFFFEGLHRTRVLLVAILAVILAGSLLVPFARLLPPTLQRSLAFLPLPLSAQARLEAEGSTEWRLQIWRDLWPKVPGYLLLGKGYLLQAEDFQYFGQGGLVNSAAATMDQSNTSFGVTGDYHSGPLSILIPFGLWGGLAFLWVTLAGLRVLYRNFRYGDPELRTINAFLLAWYIQRCLTFFFVFGGFEADIFLFMRTVGFSLALNGGICRPQPRATEAQPFPRPPQPLPA